MCSREVSKQSGGVTPADTPSPFRSSLWCHIPDSSRKLWIFAFMSMEKIGYGSDRSRLSRREKTFVRGMNNGDARCLNATLLPFRNSSQRFSAR